MLLQHHILYVMPSISLQTLITSGVTGWSKMWTFSGKLQLPFWLQHYHCSTMFSVNSFTLYTHVSGDQRASKLLFKNLYVHICMYACIESDMCAPQCAWEGQRTASALALSSHRGWHRVSYFSTPWSKLDSAQASRDCPVSTSWRNARIVGMHATASNFYVGAEVSNSDPQTCVASTESQPSPEKHFLWSTWNQSFFSLQVIQSELQFLHSALPAGSNQEQSATG